MQIIYHKVVNKHFFKNFFQRSAPTTIVGPSYGLHKNLCDMLPALLGERDTKKFSSCLSQTIMLIITLPVLFNDSNVLYLQQPVIFHHPSAKHLIVKYKSLHFAFLLPILNKSLYVQCEIPLIVFIYDICDNEE